VRVAEWQSIQQKVEEGVAHNVDRNFVATAEDDGVAVAEVADVGDAADEWLDDDGEGAILGGIENFAEVGASHQDDLRYLIVEALDFAIVDGLHVAPELANLLFLVIGGKQLVETLEGENFRGQLLAAE
jgi:hypothetical protein